MLYVSASTVRFVYAGLLSATSNPPEFSTTPFQKPPAMCLPKLPHPLNFALVWGVLFGYYFTVSFGDAVVEGVHVVTNEEGLVEAKTMEHVCKMLQRGQGVMHADEQRSGGQWEHSWIKLNFYHVERFVRVGDRPPSGCLASISLVWLASDEALSEERTCSRRMKVNDKEENFSTYRPDHAYSHHACCGSLRPSQSRQTSGCAVLWVEVAHIPRGGLRPRYLVGREVPEVEGEGVSVKRSPVILGEVAG
jgi:hypothetical protein